LCLRISDLGDRCLSSAADKPDLEAISLPCTSLKDKTNHQNQTNSNSKLGVLDEDSQSNSDSALDTGSGSDAETVSRISISSDDGELVTIEKLKNSDTNTVPSRNIESPVNGYRKVLFVCNL